MSSQYQQLQWVAAAMCCVFRVCNALFVRTYFNPDEYWQSLEVAHRLVFGYGHLTWEWQPGIEIRGYTHPAVFALYYKVVELLGLDVHRWLIAYGPRIVQGLLAGIGDLATYELARTCYGNVVARYALIVQLFSWFYFYCAVRTFSNSMEMVFTMIGLMLWAKKRYTSALVSAALAVSIRPTAGAFWLYLGMRHLVVGFKSLRDRAKFVFANVAPIGVLSLGIMIVVDRVGYGKWTFVPWNFVRINLLQGAAGNEYGVHAWHWYFTQGFLAVVGTWLVYGAYGVYKVYKTHNHQPGWIFEFVVWSLLILSLVRHKEFRFALPLLPPMSVYCGVGLAHVFHFGKNNPALKEFVLLALVLASNVIAALYLSRYHQAAPLDVMDFLAECKAPQVRFVDFYSPCHSTPYHSHLHRGANVSMRFLDCSPNVAALRSIQGMHFSATYGIEEEDRFQMNQLAFVKERFLNEGSRWPSHIVYTDDLDQVFVDFFLLNRGHPYVECGKFRHTFDISFVVLCCEQCEN